MKNVGVIGGGLIGASWAAIFSKSGFNVLVHDSHPEVFESFESRVQLFLEELKSIDDSINVEESLKRIKINVTIEELCSSVNYIQESAPEILSVKQELFAKLDNLASDDIVIASSSSAMPISSITQNLRGQHRCIIAHPANPPHLIPCVELCPSENTSQKTIEKTQEIFKLSGASIVNVRK